MAGLIGPAILILHVQDAIYKSFYFSIHADR